MVFESDWIEDDEDMELGSDYKLDPLPLINSHVSAVTGPGAAAIIKPPLIQYAVANPKVLKHQKDVVSTNKPSSRSEAVKDLSLDDVIAERKISTANGRKDNNNTVRRQGQAQGDSGGFRIPSSVVSPNDENELNMSLDEVARHRGIGAKKGGAANVGGTSSPRKEDLDKGLDEIIQERHIDSSGSGGRQRSNNGFYQVKQPQKRKPETNIDTDTESQCSTSGGPRRGGRGGKKMREDNGESDPVFVTSPCDVIKGFTTHDGWIIEEDTANMIETGGKGAHSWQSTLRCGNVVVTVDATLKDLAKQAAAMELLNIVKKILPEQLIPECAIPEGVFYSPAIVEKLIETTTVMSLPRPNFEFVFTRRRGRDYSIAICRVGEDEFTGESYDHDHAKLFAAKAAYETFAMKEVPRGKFEVVTLDATDKEGLRLHESEVTHALSVAKLQYEEIANNRDFGRDAPTTAGGANEPEPQIKTEEED